MYVQLPPDDPLMKGYEDLFPTRKGKWNRKKKVGESTDDAVTSSAISYGPEEVK